MKYYKTLHDIEYDLDSLSSPHKNFIKRMISYYKKNPHWNVFSNHWINEGRKIWENMKRKDVIKHPTFKICQDMESRLGIKQGYVRQTDYRDELQEIIDRFPSRYQFCKEVGIDETFISHVLSKRKNLSIIKLEGLLDKLGYTLTFTKKQEMHKI